MLLLNVGGTDNIFESLTEKIATDTDEWEEWFNLPNPEYSDFPGDYRTLQEIPKLILMRVLRPDRLPYTLSEYVKKNLDVNFIKEKEIDLDVIYTYTTCYSPVLFILYDSNDCVESVDIFAKKKNMTPENGKFVSLR